MSIIFSSQSLGPLRLKNRVIRSAAFENMCYDNRPSQQLFDFHLALARGGVAMTTVAYAAVSQSGLSFRNQLWLRPQVVPDLKKLTLALHQHQCLASIQLGHCGNMTHKSTCGQTPVGASSGFNLYSPTWVRGLTVQEIKNIAKDFGKAVTLAQEAGFDAVEIHAGHGYLISQFLSPYTNKRKDEFGMSLQNRMRFMDLVMEEVMSAAQNNIAVIVKTNMYDGFKQGIQIDEAIQIAKRLQQWQVHALVLSAGFVSKAPMHIMRGRMPIKTLAYYMDMKKFWWLKFFLNLAGRQMIPSVKFAEAYFLKDAKKFRQELSLPLIYVGGLISKKKIEEVLHSGFVAVQIARALFHDSNFVRKLEKKNFQSNCKHSNYCIARMYSLEAQCHHHSKNLPTKVVKEIKKMEQKVF